MPMLPEQTLSASKQASDFGATVPLSGVIDPKSFADHLSEHFSPILAVLSPQIKYDFKFDYFKELPRMHLELSIVKVENDRCTFTLPMEWLEPNGHVYIRRLMKKLLPIAPVIGELYPLSEASFVFEIGDTGYLPSVSYSSKNNFACLILDWDYFCSGGYNAFREHARLHPIPWIERRSEVFWRGQSTGLRRHKPPAPDELDNFTWLPRAWLCLTAKHSIFRENCDIGLSGITQISEKHLIDMVTRYSLLKKRVDKFDFLKYKFLIDIDGNSNAWSGLFTGLLSGACIIKVKSERDFRQWYYSDLIPFVNYIPMASDFTDFDQVVDWTIRNDSSAKTIGEKGRDVAEHISVEQSISSSAKNLKRWLSTSVPASFIASMGR